MVAILLKPDPQKPAYYVMHDIQNLNSDPYQHRYSLRSHVWRPPTDVFEIEDAIVVRVEIAGMREQDITILLDGRVLSVRGTRSEVPERRAYHQMEISFGEFVSDIELPYPVIVDQVQAIYDNGFLRIVLPRERPRRIQVDD